MTEQLSPFLLKISCTEYFIAQLNCIEWLDPRMILRPVVTFNSKLHTKLINKKYRKINPADSLVGSIEDLSCAVFAGCVFDSRHPTNECLVNPLARCLCSSYFVRKAFSLYIILTFQICE